jgi:hypothetical protein
MNMVQRAVSYGGKLAPLVIPNDITLGTGLMNPSIFIDAEGDILVNLRHINYTLYHSENNQQFISMWGPMAYLHPEKDMRLVTNNYLCRLNSELTITNYTKVEMQELHTPIWDFHGLEDARLVQWFDKYYLVGVRRDTTPNGQGRMEYSRIEIDKVNWTAKEIWRTRIPAPAPDASYCEKNWAPVLDKPYHFIKWSMNTDLVWADPDISEVKQIFIKETPTPPADQRGGSQVITWGDYYLSCVHETQLFNNYMGQKDGIYRHRFIIWDREFNFKGMTEPFSFLDARVEFCVGAAIFEGDLLLSFGFQDNAAFILRTPKALVDEMVSEALSVPR